MVNEITSNIYTLIFISITLTETEKGKGPPLEFVGIPNIVKKELGLLYFSMLGMVYLML